MLKQFAGVKKGFFLWVFFVPAVLSAQRQGKVATVYPSFDEVADHQSKFLPVIDDTTLLQKYALAKTPEGWLCQIQKYEDNQWQPTDSKLCWSAEKRKFLVNKTSNKNEVAAHVKKQFYRYPPLTYGFIEQNYFGYRGWTDDVINLLKDSANLCDYNYESLARAYSSEAFYRINQWSDFSLPERRMLLPEKPNCMTAAQVDTFCKYENLSAQTYLRLYKQNPKYETRVGDVYCKYSNEIMAAYLILAHYQNMEEAAKVLKDGLYDSFMIAFAKDMLNSCGQNGILITQGDNDTYPLYYVQAKYGFRKDVLVVNSSLLGTSRYINFVRSGVFDAPPFPMTLDTAAYAGDSLNYLRRKDKKYTQMVKATGLDFNPNADIIYKGDIAMLNMIAANNWQRPVYLAFTVGEEVALNMDKYFRQNGFAYLLTKDAKVAPALYNTDVNTDFSYPFLMQKMESVDWNNLPITGDDVLRIVSNYQGVYSRTAKALWTEEKYDECLNVLNKYMEDFPENKIPYTVYMVDMPDLYAKCKHLAQAKALTEKLTIIGNEGYAAHINNSANESLDGWKRHMDESLYILQQLVPLVKKYYVGEKYADQYEAEFNTKHAKYYKIWTELTSGK